MSGGQKRRDFCYDRIEVISICFYRIYIPIGGFQVLLSPEYLSIIHKMVMVNNAREESMRKVNLCDKLL